jgi:hypothetical protein
VVGRELDGAGVELAVEPAALEALELVVEPPSTVGADVLVVPLVRAAGVV